MTELIAYRYKLRTATGGVTAWTSWRTGRLRGEMMAELREHGRDTVVIAQCCVPRSEPDETTGRDNYLWEWTKRNGWKKTDRRNWFVDSCDPTYRPEEQVEPWDLPISQERLIYWHKKLYGIEDITNAITTAEMAEEADKQ